MEQILIVLFVLISIAMVALILMQQGKGSDMGTAFGSGASATVFGSRGAANFLSRTSAILATIWFLLAMTLGYFAINTKDEGIDVGIMEGVLPETKQVDEIPAGAQPMLPESMQTPKVPDDELPDLQEAPTPHNNGDVELPSVPENGSVPQISSDATTSRVQDKAIGASSIEIEANRELPVIPTQ